MQEGTSLIPDHTDVTAPGRDAAGGERMMPENCRIVGGILARIGDKWSVLVVMYLSEESRRFNELKRRIDGISQRMLTLTLRGLERDGLVSRTVTPTIPPRVDYALTDLGRSLRQPVQALGLWALDNHAAIDKARERYDGAKG